MCLCGGTCAYAQARNSNSCLRFFKPRLHECIITQPKPSVSSLLRHTQAHNALVCSPRLAQARSLVCARLLAPALTKLDINPCLQARRVDIICPKFFTRRVPGTKYPKPASKSFQNSLGRITPAGTTSHLTSSQSVWYRVDVETSHDCQSRQGSLLQEASQAPLQPNSKPEASLG